MNAADPHPVLTSGILNLTGCVKLRLAGPDALRYLNGQVSNDVRRLAVGESQRACVCTHKGKLEALVTISRAEDAFYLTAEAALRDFLPLRMEKYLIADDAVLEDVTEMFDLVHRFGGESGLGSEMAPRRPHAQYVASRMGVPGVDHWLERGAADEMTVTDPALADLLRIDRGIPAWETELAGGILPPEARLEATAIDYYKGCYTGQEVISRLRSVGQVNRRLERLVALDGARIDPGWQLFAVAGEGVRTAAGNVTSAAWHPGLKQWIALGFVKRSAAGAKLMAAQDASAPGAAVEIRKSLDDGRP
jgi:folate-binding protein YgfZ